MSGKIPRDLRPVFKVIREQGFEISFTTKGHIQVHRNGRRVASIGGSPSDPRSIKNFRAELRRAGATGI